MNKTLLAVLVGLVSADVSAGDVVKKTNDFVKATQFTNDSANLAVTSYKLLSISSANRLAAESAKTLKSIKELKQANINSVFLGMANSKMDKVAKESLEFSYNLQKSNAGDFLNDAAKASNAGSVLDKVGMGLSVIGAGINIYNDTEKYGSSNSELVQSVLLGTSDILSSYLNIANGASGANAGKAALAQGGSAVASFVVEKTGDGKGGDQYAKIILDTVANPFGQLTNIVREMRATGKALLDMDKTLINRKDQIQSISEAIIKQGEWVSKSEMGMVLESDNVETFLKNVNQTLDTRAELIKKANLEVIEMQTILNEVRGDISFFDPARDDRRQMYDSMIATLSIVQSDLFNLQRSFNDPDLRNKYISNYADAWILAKIMIMQTNSKNEFAQLINDEKNLEPILPAAPREPDPSLILNTTTNLVSNNSHMGSANPYVGNTPYYTSEDAVKGLKSSLIAANGNSSLNTNTATIKTGLQQSTTVNTIPFNTNGSKDWVLVTGDSKHLSFGNSFGSITAPNGGRIAALNNADVAQTVMQREITLPTGTKQVTVSLMANFVTNEYPKFVGSQFNDKSIIEIKTGSGNVYEAVLFNKELNSANFQSVTNLPSPMSPSGGQTGFESVSKTINVANGGNLTITVKTTNVGDTAYPSATLINNTNVK